MFCCLPVITLGAGGERGVVGAGRGLRQTSHEPSETIRGLISSDHGTA